MKLFLLCGMNVYVYWLGVMLVLLVVIVVVGVVLVIVVSVELFGKVLCVLLQFDGGMLIYWVECFGEMVVVEFWFGF